jgi:dephospho-CoA kinase|tara:strand:- start:1993 stop:2607 length:615 start_codon:yes stop_codon:yes gene_type:complete
MSLKQTVLLGLTGSIGMGKSTTAAMFLKRGIPVWDADSTVHKLYAKNGAAVKFFNQEIPSAVSNGEVSRVALKKLIKEDINNLKKIEQIVHPLVAKDRLTFIENSKKYNAPLIVLDIPLLFETGFYKLVDYIAVVTVDYTTQKQRVLDRESMTEEMFTQILDKQVSNEEKKRKADFIIPTETIEAAESKVQEIIFQLERQVRNA